MRPKSADPLLASAVLRDRRYRLWTSGQTPHDREQATPSHPLESVLIVVEVAAEDGSTTLGCDWLVEAADYSLHGAGFVAVVAVSAQPLSHAFAERWQLYALPLLQDFAGGFPGRPSPLIGEHGDLVDEMRVGRPAGWD